MDHVIGPNTEPVCEQQCKQQCKMQHSSSWEVYFHTYTKQSAIKGPENIMYTMIKQKGQFTKTKTDVHSQKYTHMNNLN